MCAGWLLHVSKSRYMKDMGGLRRNLPITFASMLVVALSLAGIIPFSGFWSKDAILSAAANAGAIGVDLYVLGVVTTLMTAFYSVRIIGLVFFGEKSQNLQKIENEYPIHEAPLSMMVPFVILAGATLVLGILAPFWFEPHLGGLFSSYLSQFGITSSYSLNLIADKVPISIGLSLAVLGALIGYLAYVRKTIKPEAIVGSSDLVRSFYTFFAHRWYINALYYRGIVYPVEVWSNWLFQNFEKSVIQPINSGATEIGAGISESFRKLQSGIEEEYILAFGIGIAMIIVLLVVFGQGLI